MYRYYTIPGNKMNLTALVHDALFVFFGTSAVVAAMAHAGADPRRVSVIVGALICGTTSGTAFLAGSADDASNTLGAGLLGILLAVALAFWMKWRSER